MADKKKISGLLKATALSIVLAAIVWFAGLVFNPPGLEMVLAIAAIVFSITFFVGDECSSQKQLISRLIPQMVHGFGLRCTIFFDLMCLICYDKVGMKGKKVFLQSPCRFIIDNSDLQIIPAQLGKLFFFLCTAAFQNSQLIWKSSKTCKFLFPDRENRQWCCDQDSSDMTILIQNSNNGNAGDGLSAAHFHEQCHAITVCL